MMSFEKFMELSHKEMEDFRKFVAETCEIPINDSYAENECSAISLLYEDIKIKLEEIEGHPFYFTQWQEFIIKLFLLHRGRRSGKTYLIETLKLIDQEDIWS